MSEMTGKAIKFGDNINTDIISPPQYMELSIEEASKYSMSAVRPNFYEEVREQNILVAGNNLGSGSSRETSGNPAPRSHLETARSETLSRDASSFCVKFSS